MTDPVEILRELVAIPSPSEASNAGVVEYAVRFLQACGWVTQVYPYRDGEGTLKLNLVAITPTGSKRPRKAELALCGHTDTVPWDPAWSEATRLTEREGRLYGRGACDMKGFVAAALAVARDVDRFTLAKPLAIVLTADEEIGCVGAKHLAAMQAFKARYAILGEPTSLKPVRAGKGYAVAEVVVRGKEAHSAFPERGISAVFPAGAVLRKVERLGVSLERFQNPLFDPPHTTLNVGTIAGGRAKNIVPDECRFLVEWRCVPGTAEEQVRSPLRRAVSRVQEDYPGIATSVAVQRSDPGFETGAKSELVALLEGLTGQPAGAVAFYTEAPQFQRLGAEVVVLGPGDMRVAHRTGEFVPRAEVEACVGILRQAVIKLCGSPPP